MLRFTFDDLGIHCFREQKEIDENGKQIEYDEKRGYGFLEEAGTFPKRKQDLSRIEMYKDGFWIEESEKTLTWHHENHYNYGGMTYRVALEPGTYKVEVTVSSKIEETAVSMGGMIANQLMAKGPWSAAGLVMRCQSASWKGQTWVYEYVLGKQFLEIEIEPNWQAQVRPVGVKTRLGLKEICITPIEISNNRQQELPVMHLLGDSTVKSYVYEEAPMNGWGQIIGKYLDTDKVSVLNCSQGGRSLKTMYQEGRLNDLLLHGKPGDYIVLQSGHNDESREEIKGIEARFGRGNTEETFTNWLETYFIPAIKARQMKPIFVTCMTRINHDFYSRTDIENFDHEPIHFDGFRYGKNPGINFPEIMKLVGIRYSIPVIDLYEMSIDYINQIGGEAAKAMFLSLEAGETPGKTNTGSYANGNPSQNCDGTHYKECLGKQFIRLLLTDMVKQKLEIAQYIKKEYKSVLESGEASKIERKLFPEVAEDMRTGKAAYYRNQAEKLVQLGIVSLDEKGCFRPYEIMTAYEYQRAIEKLWGISLQEQNKYLNQEALTVEKMGEIIYEAYSRKFGRDEKGRWHKPKYMTDYNGVNLSPDDPNYDSNLVGESAQYYPLVPWEQLEDLEEIGEVLGIEEKVQLHEKLKAVYELGMLRSEKNLLRGKMVNGRLLEPNRQVTREKAAKSLYFLFVLAKPIKTES